MSCTKPNFIFIDYATNRTGIYEKKVHFIPGSHKYSEDYRSYLINSGAIEVPCGNCVSCRLDHSRVWANRCYLESLSHPHSWFITLTYDDEHLPIGSKGYATLENDAISQFMKKYRKHFGYNSNIRYLGCGEYGEAKGDRAGFNPHYHLIVFADTIPDLTIDHPDRTKPVLRSGKYPIFRRKNHDGDYVLYSETIFNMWQKGKVEIEEATWNTAAYVSRYIMKKQKGMNSDVYERLGIVPEMLRMSTHPGIGFDWMNANKDKLLRYDYLSVKNKAGVQTSRPPRYFEKMMMRDPDSREAASFEGNKLTRIVNSKKKSKESSSKKSVAAKLQDEADFFEKKTKMLTRNLT